VLSEFCRRRKAFLELGRNVSLDKTSLKDSPVTQKEVVASDVRLNRRLAREAHGSLGVPSRTQQRFIDAGAVLKRLRSIDAGTLSAVDDETEEAVEVMDAPSEAVGDLDERVLADSALIDVEDDEGDPPVAFIDDGSVESASSEEVTATETGFMDFDTLLDHVAEATVKLGWDCSLSRMRTMSKTMKRRRMTSGCGSSSSMRWRGYPAALRVMIRAEICPVTVYSVLGDSRSPCATS
jgi:hypothetical protein